MRKERAAVLCNEINNINGRPVASVIEPIDDWCIVVRNRDTGNIIGHARDEQSALDMIERMKKFSS